MNKILGIMGVVGLLFAGCSSEDDILSSFHNDPDAVHITAEVGKASADGFTRSNPLGDAQTQKQFNKDDEISVKADGQEAVTYKLVGSEWQPQGGKFLKWESDEMNFTAYYPASYNGGEITQPLEFPTEKSLADADFMSYSDKQSNTNGNTLTLTMQRKMARVVVEVVKFNDQYAGATIDNINSLSICGVKAYKHNDNKFYALIDPNYTPSTTAPFLTLEVAEGESKTTETLTNIPTLVAGKSYTYQLTVGKNKVVVTGITVADWNTGEITGGKAELYAPYVTFTAAEAQTFTLENNGYFPSNIEYSVGTDAWKKLEEGHDPIPFGGDKGDLRLRGTDNLKGTSTGYNKNTYTYAYSNIKFGTDAKVKCTGDIRTLLDYKTYKAVETNNARFCYLLKNCTQLTSAPDLPAPTLADYCYYAMFWGCANLVNAPALPAEILADYCYNSMFWNCANLVNAPALPAEILADNCYGTMFYGCTNLVNAPALPAEILANNCYGAMFFNCKKLVTAPTLSAETLADYCYNSMFHGCTNLKTAPTLSAKTLANGCYMTMFNGCTNLESAPDLPATELKESCYYGMFRSCTNLKTAPTLSATTLENACYGTMFKDCTNLETAPALPAETLKDNCYSEMFAGCKKLSSVTMSAPSDQITGTSNCCINWLKDAGTGATSRTLNVKNQAAYNALKGYLPADYWQIGPCKVLDKDGNEITE